MFRRSPVALARSPKKSSKTFPSGQGDLACEKEKADARPVTKRDETRRGLPGVFLFVCCFLLVLLVWFCVFWFWPIFGLVGDCWVLGLNLG